MKYEHSHSSERGSTVRRSRYALMALLTVAIFCATASSALAKKAVHVDIVSQAGPPAGPIPANTSYFTTIQAAVNATQKGDWVLIESGLYHEEVTVPKSHGGIHIRGMDRNGVILDGEHEAAPGGSNGIYVDGANDVWIENLTARNYDRYTSSGPGGNEIWWAGGEDSKKQNVHGWWGSYLTAYDDGLNGGYGIFTQNEHEGAWENIYASGFNDSGIYIGACWECKARVSRATIEYNAVGYSGSNSGGRLVIEKSTFRHNSSGIVPNGENPGDGPPPQNGKCNSHRPRSPYVIFTSTNIERCTIFKENLITENNDLEVPANPSTEKAPWGVGVELPGDYADLVENNTITNNVNNGVLGFEYPNPYPPEECTKTEEEEDKCSKTIYFQLSGNKIAGNTFANNGTSGKEFASDITLQGGIYPHGPHLSTQNCVSGNTLAGATFPANIEETWGCQNATTPPPNNGLAAIGYLVILSTESAERKAVPQADPPPQPTMPEPCQGVPSDPLCP